MAESTSKGWVLFIFPTIGLLVGSVLAAVFWLAAFNSITGGMEAFQAMEPDIRIGLLMSGSTIFSLWVVPPVIAIGSGLAGYVLARFFS